MEKLGLYVSLEAKPAKNEEMDQFLRSELPLVNAEAGTAGSLVGKVAEALFAKAPELFSTAPEVHKLEILAWK